jgi:hypothetical protein
MNIILLFIIALLMALVALVFFKATRPREECHNAKAPAEKEPETAETNEISEDEIAPKVRAGLTRAQAIEVITNQRIHDAELAKAEKPKG